MKNTQTKTTKRRKAYLVVIHLCFALVTAAFFAFVFGYLVMLLWGVTISTIFNVPEISYLQGVGLVLLARLLVGGLGTKYGHGSSHGSANEQNSQTKSNGEQNTLTLQDGESSAIELDPEMKKHYQNFWEKEGKQAFEEYVKNL